MYLSRRNAFSMVDLLAVLASLGSLLALGALLLGCTAIDSRQISCKNNMNQLALGVLSFEATQQRYPGYANTVGEKPAGWAVPILPFLDHHDWYDEWQDPSVKLADVPKSYSDLFCCPNDPPTEASGPANSYVINAGAAPVENEKPANGIAHNYRENGIFTNTEYVAANDGMSHTLLLSENVQAGAWHVAEKQSNVFVWHADGMNNRPRRRINGYGKQDRSLIKVPLTADSARPSSFHSGGVNVAFCDRRTVFLRDDIDYTVYMQLMTPAGLESDMPEDAKKHPLQEIDFSEAQQQDPTSVLACSSEQ